MLEEYERCPGAILANEIRAGPPVPGNDLLQTTRVLNVDGGHPYQEFGGWCADAVPNHLHPNRLVYSFHLDELPPKRQAGDHGRETPSIVLLPAQVQEQATFSRRIWRCVRQLKTHCEVVNRFEGRDDLRHAQLDAVPAPELFGPYTAEPGLHRFTVVARTSGSPLDAAPTFRRALSELDASQPIYDIETMEHTLADTVASRRFNLYALGTFAGAAVLLALIGVYGVTAYSVARRRHELGVRMALGAQRGDVVRLVLGEGTGAMVAGLAIGLLAAIGLTRVMDSLLYGVTPTDPQTFLAVSGLLVVSTLMACGVPALKATRVDALRELRNE